MIAAGWFFDLTSFTSHRLRIFHQLFSFVLFIFFFLFCSFYLHQLASPLILPTKVTWTLLRFNREKSSKRLVTFSSLFRVIMGLYLLRTGSWTNYLRCSHLATPILKSSSGECQTGVILKTYCQRSAFLSKIMRWTRRKEHGSLFSWL